MKRGRRPRPAATLEALGRKPRRRKWPAPPAGAPPEPRDLDPEALQVWHELVQQLASLKLLSTADAEVIRLAAGHISDYRRLRAAFLVGELETPATGGARKISPTFWAMAGASDRALRALKELRLTTACRDMPQPCEPEPDPNDGLEKLLRDAERWHKEDTKKWEQDRAQKEDGE